MSYICEKCEKEAKGLIIVVCEECYYKTNKDIKDLKEKLRKTELSLAIYETYTDQIVFTAKDIEALDVLSQETV